MKGRVAQFRASGVYCLPLVRPHSGRVDHEQCGSMIIGERICASWQNVHKDIGRLFAQFEGGFPIIATIFLDSFLW